MEITFLEGEKFEAGFFNFFCINRRIWKTWKNLWIRSKFNGKGCMLFIERSEFAFFQYPFYYLEDSTKKSGTFLFDDCLAERSYL